MAWEYEYTDTFGGEANYSWVRRGIIDLPTDDGLPADDIEAHMRKLRRKAKAAVGLTGVRGVWEDWGETEAFRPHGMCTVLFVSWHDYCPNDYASNTCPFCPDKGE